LDTLLWRFEEAWQQGRQPSIEDYLPPGDVAALAELVHIDLERRLKAGEKVRVEDYLKRYPALVGDPGAMLALVGTEYEQRRRHEPGLTPAEYYPRFPQYAAQLRQRLEQSPPAPAAPPDLDDPRARQATASPAAAPDGAVQGPQGMGPWPRPRYRPLRFHARGGLGEVLVALDEEFGREVALKCIQEPFADDPESRRRFLREAEITGRLEHPGVVPAYSLAQDEQGRPCYAMRFIQGETLQDACRRFHHEDRPDPGARVLALRQLLSRFVAVCNTVAYAHARGVLHRDLKPSNIMLGNYGETLVVDWGLAKTLDRTEGAQGATGPPTEPDAAAGDTRTGQTLGTPPYMSPEQAEGNWDAVGPASDIYSLGATLYTLLTGESPVRGEASEVLGRVRRGDFPAPRQRTREVPRPLEAVCLKAMALEPGDRYPTALALAEDIEHWLAGEPVTVYRAPWTARAWRWVRRHRTPMAALAAALTAATLLAVGGWLWLEKRAAREEEALRQGVKAALDRAAELRTQSRFAEAGTVLEQARDRLGEAGPADLRRRVEQARSDLLLVGRLDAARLLAAAYAEGNLDYAAADRAYAAAFREWRLGRPGEAVEAVAGRIRASADREQLVAALDDWALAAQTRARQDWVLAVARRVDPDPWRNRVRSSRRLKDRAAVERLARDFPVTRLSPQLAAVLGVALHAQGADRVAFLKAAVEHYPQDFWLNYELGNAYIKDRPQEALGYYRVALALRPGTPAVYVNLGLALERAGRLDEAIAAGRRAVALDPQSVHAHSALGHSLKGAGRLDEASAAFRKAVALAPRVAWTHYNLGTALHACKRLDQAIAELHKAIALDPSYDKAHQALGLDLAALGRADEALAALRRAVVLAPRDAEAHNNLGYFLHVQGRPDEAITCYRRAIASNPRFAPAHSNLGGVLVDQGRVNEAVAECRQAVALDPGLAEAHASLGNVLTGIGRLDEAVAECRKAIALQPRSVPGHFNLGNALAAQGKRDEAIACYLRALALNPQHVKAHANLGAALMNQGRLDEAGAEFQQAIALAPKDARAHFNLGSNQLARGRLDEAIACYRQAVALDPRWVTGHSQLGKVLFTRGRQEEAIKEYRLALALDPRDADACNHLGTALLARGRRDEALAAYRRVIALGRGDAVTHGNLGTILFGRRRWGEAGAEFQKAITLAPREVLLHVKLGFALQMQDRLDEARAAYGRACAINPNSGEAQALLGGVLIPAGQFSEARDRLRRSLELLPQKHALRLDAAQQLQKCEQLLALEAKLPALLKGEVRPASAAEWLSYAQLCRWKKLYEASARCYADAFAAEPKLADNMLIGYRYTAACCAALAARTPTGPGGLDGSRRAHWRKQALDWLRADLAQLDQHLKWGPVVRDAVRRRLIQWQQSPELAGARDEAQLAWLPEEEQVAWRRLWADVDALRDRAARPK
jgi:tetratricopeptide (TPR) repeat protein